MKVPLKKFRPTETTKLLDELNKLFYIFAFRGFWVEEVKLPKTFVKIYDAMYPALNVSLVIFCALQIGAHFTQKHLNIQQKININIMGIAQPLTKLCCLNCMYYKEECKQVLYHLFVAVKEIYNDEETEKMLVKKLKFSLWVYMFSSVSTTLLYGMYALIEMVRSGSTFVGTVTAWPDTTDTSALAACARVYLYFFWIVYTSTGSMVILMVLTFFMGLTYQYKNLQKYFENLNSIFEDKQVTHEELEMNFEKALQKGIKAHSDTLWCVNQCQTICKRINMAIVLINTGILIVLMQGFLDSKDDILKVGTCLIVLGMCLMILAFFMWNAGDVTVEAQKLSDAIYSSGWYNCYGKRSARIRSLVVIAMIQAQEPVVFTAFGVIELSYETYVAIIKSAYSVFSVLY
ncbi:uncharacterized protein LOC115446599 [Manduca sexta]|uniref:Odorant receptor n=1 Tax=Manduca sexta TaxID=7130 RepID=E1ACG2_MANSE|nr:uncharacterized protein LOC115446599 [Manduca sexta]ADM32898.1 odorant receptor OR-5 [Manduca sexta]KAG6454916.1 hypothetical protein O3G_MSEX008966 [Manduca sexta]CUQ99389.1 Olfactory receptor 5 [Manduca sexta]